MFQKVWSTSLRQPTLVLRPADVDAEELMFKVPRDRPVRATVTVPRSTPHHNLFFKILREVYDNGPAGEAFPSFDTFRDALSIEIGHCTISKGFDGQWHKFPKSWRFSKVDQVQFNALFEKSMAVIVQAGFVDEGYARQKFEELLGYPLGRAA